MTTLTAAEEAKIADFLEGRHIPSGLGTEEEACSIAAINIALFGRLTDEIPRCMSEVIGRWIVLVQDAMPDEMRNSPEWRALLPMAAATGRHAERERLDVLLAHMSTVVLPLAQPADEWREWRGRCEQKTTHVHAVPPTAATAAAHAYAAAATAAADWPAIDPPALLALLIATGDTQ